MAEQFKMGRFNFVGERPGEFDDERESSHEISGGEQEAVLAVATTIEQYLAAASKLLAGKYAHLREMVPAHLSSRGNTLVCLCPEGVVVRFEREVPTPHTYAGWYTGSLLELAATLSQFVIKGRLEKVDSPSVDPRAPDIHLFVQSPNGQTRELARAKLGIDIVIQRPDHMPLPPHKPYCVASVQNSFEILVGLNFVAEHRHAGGQKAVVRSPLKMPVGWECIEVYPFFDQTNWRPENAELWADNDILAQVVARQTREAHFNSLDPKASARKLLSDLLDEYSRLLESEPDREETLQEFLSKNPYLLSPSHIKVWPKQALGGHVTDFVIQEANGDYLLVELEKSTHRLFVKSGDPSKELNHARKQTIDWKRYIEDNLVTVQRELGLANISVNPKCIIVIGRSSKLSDKDRRALVTIENESPKLKILTYDDVLNNAKAIIENLLGPISAPVGNTQMYYLPSGAQP